MADHGLFYADSDSGPVEAVLLELYLKQEKLPYFVTERLDHPSSTSKRGFPTEDRGNGVVLTDYSSSFVLATAPNLEALAEALKDDSRFHSALFCQLREDGPRRTVMQVVADQYNEKPEESVSHNKPNDRSSGWWANLSHLVERLVPQVSIRISVWWRRRFYPDCGRKR